MNRIGVVIITLNEEKNIERCLQSVHDVVDEIVVADSYSTDETENICRRFSKVKFLQRRWTGYSDQRNFANAHIESDFILTLDADEALSEEMKRELKRLKPELKPNQAYYINRKTFYCGAWINHSGWNPDYQMRFFPKAGSRWDGAEVHESVILPEGTERKHFKGRVFHFSYSSILDHVNRANAYAKLGAEKLVKKNKGGFLLASVTRPFLRFFKTFFIKAGFLDGYRGFCISIIASYGVFLKYFMAYELKNKMDGKSD